MNRTDSFASASMAFARVVRSSSVSRRRFPGRGRILIGVAFPQHRFKLPGNLQHEGLLLKFESLTVHHMASDRTGIASAVARIDENCRDSPELGLRGKTLSANARKL
jgi:hypothetical protein